MSLEFKRQCPACGIEIVYSFSQAFYRARKHNRKCFKCSCNNEWKEKISNCFKGKTRSEILNGNPNYSKTCPSCGEIQYYSTKRKLNLSIGENRECFSCSRPEGKLSEDFILECKKVHGNLYDYSKIHYQNNECDIEIICPKHGSFWQKPRTHLSQKSGCPKCNLSSGEISIMNYLDRVKIEYIHEHRFTDCRSLKNKVLRFDFFLPTKNVAIEFDGPCHFTTKYGAKYKVDEDTLKGVQQRDQIKNDYCHKNRIGLIRISYWDSCKINKILSALL
jgi:hypothetical protein